jgi:hypothetical protein
MKLWVTILCFYLFALTAAPTISIIKKHFAQKCESSCQKKESNTQNSCQKDKCILCTSFSPSQFILCQIQNISLNRNFKKEKKENLYYKKSLVKNYKNNIWQPPEILFET